MAGLYIHIPFCESRCAYCDFYKSTDAANIPGFLEALKREMTVRRYFLATGRLDTIYIGGGTPSLLSVGQLQGLLDHAAELWDCSELREVTLEANPEDLTNDYLARLRRYEADSSHSVHSFRNDILFNRLSIGVQSFDDGLLRLMNRRHSAARAREAVRAAQRAGFENITIDLIYGIPGMTDAQWERTLDEAIALGVQHISAYHLTIEPGTAFWKMFESAETHHPGALRHPSTGGEPPVHPVAEEDSERQFETLRRKLTGVGFEHYEISNFALPGRRAVHNSAYWSGEPYLGVGPSAHSFDGERRREWVAADVEKYIASHPSVKTDGNENKEFSSQRGLKPSKMCHSPSIYEGETLSEEELFNERVMTALRTAEGLDIASVESRFGAQRVAGFNRRAARFLAEELLVKRGVRMAISPEKFLLSDYIIGELFEDGN